MADVFDAIINGEEAEAAVEAPATAAPEPIAANAEPTGKKETTPPVVDEEVKPNEHGLVPLAALKEERAKRQEHERQTKEYEARLAEYEAKLKAQVPETPAAKPAEPAKPEKEISFFDDPEGYIKAQLEKERAEREAFQASVRNQSIIREYEAMRTDPKTAADFEALMQEFQAEAVKNPILINSVARSMNPVAEAYRMAKNMREARIYGGDMDKVVEARVAEALAKREADAKAAEEKARLDKLPKSNAHRSVGASAPVQTDKADIFDEILPNAG